MRRMRRAEKYMPVSFYIVVIAVLFVFFAGTAWKGGWLLETWRSRTAALPRLAVASFTVNSSGGTVRADAATARSLVESHLAATGRYRIMTGEEIDGLFARLEIPRGDISGEESVKKLYLRTSAIS